MARIDTFTHVWPIIKAAIQNANVSDISYDETTGNITITTYDPTTGEETTTVIVNASDLVEDGGGLTTSMLGVANGVCPLDENALVDAQYLPGYIDDVVEAYARPGETPLSSTWLATGSASGPVIVPSTGKIYILMEDVTSGGEVIYNAGSQFRWGGTEYVKLNDGGIIPITNAEIDIITAN